MQARNRSFWIIGIIVISVAIQFFFITRSFIWVLTNLLPDDAFYYFKIAQNIAHGLGSTFDGTHLTNGYHPLWLLVLVGVYHFFPSGEVPVRVALSLSIVFSAITIFVVSRLMTRVTARPTLQILGTALWAFNPFVLYENLNGLETSLALLFAMTFFLFAIRAYERPTTRAYVYAGIFGGLMILARIDSIFYFGVFVLWTLFAKGWKQGFKQALAAAIPAGIALLPWFAWNILEFHMLLTSAAGGNALVNHALVQADNGSGLFVYIKTVPYMLYMNGKQLVTSTGMPALVFFMLGAGATYLADQAPRLKAWRKAPLFVVFFAGFVLLFLANAGIRWTARSWYFIILDFFVALLFVIVADAFVKRHAHEVLVASAIFIVALMSFLVGWRYDLLNRNAGQETMYEAAGWLSNHLPAGTPVGIFNAGIIGYFSTVRVVNLDGLVNNSAYDALRNRDLWNYIQSEHLGYIADFPLYLSYRYKPFYGIDNIFSKITPLTTITGSAPHNSDGDFTVYRVQDSAQQ